mmetsp:Transcript_44052/g.101649  ORF Transcript_44052/g.101649 Transcript_44052/m.101649 type:complete len:288 (-) Transcript_44052:90-953(-)
MFCRSCSATICMMHIENIYTMKAMRTKAHKKEYRELKMEASMSRNSRTKRVVRTIRSVRAARNTRILRRNEAFTNSKAVRNSKVISQTAVVTIRQSKTFHRESLPVKNSRPSQITRQDSSAMKQAAKAQSTTRNHFGLSLSPLLASCMPISICTPKNTVLHKMRTEETTSSQEAWELLATKSQTCLLIRPCAACNADMSLSPCCSCVSILVVLDFGPESGLMGSPPEPWGPARSRGEPRSSTFWPLVPSTVDAALDTEASEARRPSRSTPSTFMRCVCCMSGLEGSS